MTLDRGSRNSPAPAENETPTFEAALSRLEDIVNRLERGEITLDESLEAFREGSGLVRFCLDRLAAAEAQVQKLMAGESGPVLSPAEVESGDRQNE